MASGGMATADDAVVDTAYPLLAQARSTRVRKSEDMLLIQGANRQVATSAKSAAPRLAQAKIRSDQLNTSERDVIADLFAVLETLVVRDELPAEAQGIYDQAVLMLARRWD
jgi:hypothetical protein